MAAGDFCYPVYFKGGYSGGLLQLRHARQRPGQDVRGLEMTVTHSKGRAPRIGCQATHLTSPPACACARGRGRAATAHAALVCTYAPTMRCAGALAGGGGHDSEGAIRSLIPQLLRQAPAVPNNLLRPPHLGPSSMGPKTKRAPYEGGC